MKILWLSPTPSHPQTAGNRAHIYQLGKQLLAAGHEIIFLLYNQENASSDDIEAMRRFWPQFFVIPAVPRARKKTFGDVWGVDDWFNAKIAEAVAFFAQQGIDALLCEYIFMSKALTLVPQKTIKILDCHDRMSNRHLLLQSHAIQPDFFYTTEEQEKIALQRADIILAIQEEERAFFQTLTDNIVLELGYLSGPAPLPARPRGARLRAGMMGSGNSLNKASARRLFEALAQHPETRSQLEIVMAGTLAAEFSHETDVDLGIVADEKEFYQHVDIVINPMIDGTGLKIKTVSAFQHGKPFLSTVAGSIGLPARHPAHLCAAPEALVPFLQQLCIPGQGDRLLADLREESSRLAQRYAQSQQRQLQQLQAGIEKIRRKNAKTVLLVTEIPFWEEGIGSHSRINMLCRELNKHFSLKIFFFGSLYKERQQALEVAGLSGKVISYKQYEEKAKTIKYPETKNRVPQLETKRYDIFCKSLHLFLSKNKRFDSIIIEYIWNSYLRDAISYQCLSILDTHDVMSFRKYNLGSKKTPLDITLSKEISIYNRFNAVLFIQKEEYNAIKSQDARTIPLYCPHHTNGMHIEGPSAGVHFGFIGANNEVNKHAISWFIKNVWPLQPRKDAVLHIFGNVCHSLSINSDNIVLHGLVKDSIDIYSECNIMINPMVYGSGLKIKSVEALAFGKALLASPEAVRGIENPEKSGIIVAKSRSEFIFAMLQLSYNEIFRNKLMQDARMAAERQFSAHACYDNLVKLIERY